ncbi:CHAP domain-containing protein [Rhizobium sp. BK376]|uniref:CHAP domain-containing protein n=1 Tax=Rhizobium sp. BK376 TaxID=2512149 RepID=UPI001053CC31|nr:CHAP domain-containing protein [Rhizobium sp. BK376]TCR89816.1 uncharacterized protein (TIGR02594 family) [Rhizobium sp. BK376]
MLNRRTFVLDFAAAMAGIPGYAVAQKLGRENIVQLQYPPPSPSQNLPHQERRKPSAAEILFARAIVSRTPYGPRPIDIAQSFVDRFSRANPAAISQPSPPAAPNPLISEFIKPAGRFSGQDDIIPWCAAFVNFCIERNGGAGSNSAWSQSFLAPPFEKVTQPEEGDLAVFTCYSPSSDADMGLGHVAFFRRISENGQIVVVGGNQSNGRHTSIISEKVLETGNQPVKRRLPNGQYVTAVMRLNAFVRPG